MCKKLLTFSGVVSTIIFSGCGSDSDSASSGSVQENSGYIVHVEDPIVLHATVTDSSGLQAVEIGGGDYNFSLKPSGVISSEGGIDIGEDGVLGGDDDINLTGIKLQAPADYSVVSHLSTMVVGLKEEKEKDGENISYEDAEEYLANHYSVSKSIFSTVPSKIVDNSDKDFSNSYKIALGNLENFYTHLYSDFGYITVTVDNDTENKEITISSDNFYYSEDSSEFVNNSGGDIQITNIKVDWSGSLTTSGYTTNTTGYMNYAEGISTTTTNGYETSIDMEMLKDVVPITIPANSKFYLPLDNGNTNVSGSGVTGTYNYEYTWVLSTGQELIWDYSINFK